MRITADKNHPDYDPSRARSNVFVDGVRQRYCTFADDEEGKVLNYVPGPEGTFIAHRGELIKEVVSGKVRITPHYVVAIRKP